MHLKLCVAHLLTVTKKKITGYLLHLKSDTFMMCWIEKNYRVFIGLKYIPGKLLFGNQNKVLLVRLRWTSNQCATIGIDFGFFSKPFSKLFETTLTQLMTTICVPKCIVNLCFQAITPTYRLLGLKWRRYSLFDVCHWLVSYSAIRSYWIVFRCFLLRILNVAIKINLTQEMEASRNWTLQKPNSRATPKGLLDYSS